jgi:hypothetical protein
MKAFFCGSLAITQKTKTPGKAGVNAEAATEFNSRVRRSEGTENGFLKTLAEPPPIPSE